MWTSAIGAKIYKQRRLDRTSEHTRKGTEARTVKGSSFWPSLMTEVCVQVSFAQLSIKKVKFEIPMKQHFLNYTLSDIKNVFYTPQRVLVMRLIF